MKKDFNSNHICTIHSHENNNHDFFCKDKNCDFVFHEKNGFSKNLLFNFEKIIEIVFPEQYCLKYI